MKQAEIEAKRNKAHRANNGNTTTHSKKNHNYRIGGISYAEAVKNPDLYQRHMWRQKENIRDGNDKINIGLTPTVNDVEMEWAKSGYTRIVKNAEEINSLQKRMIEEGIMSVKVIPLGGDKVFLKVDEKEDLQSLMKDLEKNFQEEFSTIREWEPRDIGGSIYMDQSIPGPSACLE